MHAIARCQRFVPALLTLVALSLPGPLAAQWNDPWNRQPAWPQMSHQGRNTGAVVGGVAGGLLGAAIGSNNDNTGKGALIGGLTGAVAGGLLGIQRDRQVYNDQAREYQSFQYAMGSAVTFNDVIQMSQSGLGDEVIVRQISQRGVVQRPGTNDLISLKQFGVSDRVIVAMQSAWSPADGNRPAPRVEPRYYAPEPVLVETYSPPPVYFVPAPRYYFVPAPCGPRVSWGFQF